MSITIDEIAETLLRDGAVRELRILLGRVTPRDLTIAEILGLIVIARGAAMRLDDQGRTPAPVLELAQAPRAARRPRPRNRGA
jgi:hypothetical protein